MADPAVPVMPPDPTSPEVRGYPRDTVKLVTSFGLEVCALHAKSSNSILESICRVAIAFRD